MRYRARGAGKGWRPTKMKRGCAIYRPELQTPPGPLTLWHWVLMKVRKEGEAGRGGAVSGAPYTRGPGAYSTRAAKDDAKKDWRVTSCRNALPPLPAPLLS